MAVVLPMPARKPPGRPRKPETYTVADFREHLLFELGLSRRSARAYATELASIKAWCETERIRLGRIAAFQVAAYATSKPQSWSTQKQIRTTLGHYWRWRGRENPPVYAIKMPRRPRMICRALTEAEAAGFADAAASDSSREALAVALMLYQALRREEVARLRVDQFDLVDGWLQVFGKGGSTDSIPLHEIIRDMLPAFLGAEPGEHVFAGQGSRDHVHPATINLWIDRFCDRHDLPRVSCHRLRHTCLATANDRTGDLRSVQAFARHRSPDTTAGYTRATEAGLRRVVAALDYQEVDG